MPPATRSGARGALRNTSIPVTPHRTALAPSTGYGLPGARTCATSTTVEKVLEAEEGRHLAYTVIGGMPVRNYRADVTLTPATGGTRIRWAATWDATLTGRIVHGGLRTFYPQMLKDLVAAAENGAESRRTA